MEQRLTELEIRFTEQQHVLEQLSGVVYAQQRELDLLRAQVAALDEKLKAEPGLVDAERRDRPPHY